MQQEKLRIFSNTRMKKGSSKCSNVVVGGEGEAKCDLSQHDIYSQLKNATKVRQCSVNFHIYIYEVLLA